MASMLLEQGADPNAKNEEGATPLIIAILGEHVAMAGLLCTYGADVNVTYQGITALNLAMGRGLSIIGEILISHGAR